MVDVETYVSSVSSINEKDMVGTVRSERHIRLKSRQDNCTFVFSENLMNLRQIFILTWPLMAFVSLLKLNFVALSLCFFIY